jgi:hypothetical protein
MSLSSILRRSYRNPWLVMPLLVLLVYGIYLSSQWPLAGNHLFGFISFGNKFVSASESQIPLQYIGNNSGYDGTFYYRLALDPFSRDERVQGIRFDNPPYRQQRILLPALTWIFARGDPDLTATMMLVINLLAIAGLTLVGGALLISYGLSPWPALLLAFYPGFAISAARFLSEPLSCLLLLLSLLGLVHRRLAWGGFALVLAVLARETALVAALAISVIWVLQSVLHLKFDRWRAPGPVYWLPAILSYIFWQVWLLGNWSASTFSSTEQANLLVWPLTGIVASLRELLTEFSLANAFFLFMMLATISWIVMVAFIFRRAQGSFRWIWLAYLALAALLGTAVWTNSFAFLRTTTELNVAGMLIYLVVVRIPHRWVLLAWLGCWLLTAGAQGYHMHSVNQARAVSQANNATESFLPLAPQIS